MKALKDSVFVYSGSFNPLHWGHLSVAHYVEKQYNAQVVFEICRFPYGKPSLSDADILQRTAQFDSLLRPVVITNAAGFLEKSTFKYEFSSAVGTANNLCPLTFCVGHDTITRIGNPACYFNSIEETDRVIELLSSRRVKFLVFPRDGHLKDGIHKNLAKLCVFAESFVECDVSSTEIRKRTEARPLTDLEIYARRKDFS